MIILVFSDQCGAYALLFYCVFSSSRLAQKLTHTALFQPAPSIPF